MFGSTVSSACFPNPVLILICVEPKNIREVMGLRPEFCLHVNSQCLLHALTRDAGPSASTCQYSSLIL